jgi:phosphoserine phosphatase
MKHTYILDMDRTLIDTNLAMDIVKDVCMEVGIDYGEIEREQKRIESEGNSYEPMSFIESLGVLKADNFSKLFLEKATRAELLFDDAKELLEKLNEQKKDFFILTYGPKNWQALKLKAAGLSEYKFVITSEKNKGKTIGEWQKTQKLGPATLIDDKLKVIAELPEGCKGILIDRDGRYVDQNTDRIVKIHSLDDIDLHEEFDEKS